MRKRQTYSRSANAVKTQPLEATYQKIKRAHHACTYHQWSGFGCRVEVFHEDERSKIVRKCKQKSNVLTNSTTMQVTNSLHPSDTLNRKVNDRGPMRGLLRNCHGLRYSHRLQFGSKMVQNAASHTFGFEWASIKDGDKWCNGAGPRSRLPRSCQELKNWLVVRGSFVLSPKSDRIVKNCKEMHEYF